MNRVFASGSVCKEHSDKLCDRAAYSILDELSPLRLLTVDAEYSA